jgi:hypothetical protein
VLRYQRDNNGFKFTALRFMDGNGISQIYFRKVFTLIGYFFCFFTCFKGYYTGNFFIIYGNDNTYVAIEYMQVVVIALLNYTVAYTEYTPA